MLRLSRLTDYAVVTLAAMAERRGEVLSATALAEQTNVPEPTVAKILKLLARDGLVASVRGAAGGYRLDDPAGRIAIGAVVAAIEGPVALTACVEGSQASCGMEGQCALHGRWDPVNRAIRDALAAVSVADVMESKGGCAAKTALPAGEVRA
jgi:FeS assembly SUF system regulator